MRKIQISVDLFSLLKLAIQESGDASERLGARDPVPLLIAMLADVPEERLEEVCLGGRDPYIELAANKATLLMKKMVASTAHSATAVSEAMRIAARQLCRDRPEDFSSDEEADECADSLRKLTRAIRAVADRIDKHANTIGGGAKR